MKKGYQDFFFVHLQSYNEKSNFSFLETLQLSRNMSYLRMIHFCTKCCYHFLVSLCMVFDSISSNVDEVLLINPSANVFVFGDFNVHHEDWLTYSGRTDRPGELL